jgi:hypothetical protein
MGTRAEAFPPAIGWGDIGNAARLAVVASLFDDMTHWIFQYFESAEARELVEFQVCGLDSSVRFSADAAVIYLEYGLAAKCFGSRSKKIKPYPLITFPMLTKILRRQEPSTSLLSTIKL